MRSRAPTRLPPSSADLFPFTKIGVGEIRWRRSEYVEISGHAVEIEHVRMQSSKPFAAVVTALEASAPELDPELAEDLTDARTPVIAERRAHGPKLCLFHTRDHGALLAAEGRPGLLLQLEIGNRLTAERMTRHPPGAALYAPLGIIVYGTPDQGTEVEYERPSALLRQFDDPAVDSVGAELDDELERLLGAAAEDGPRPSQAQRSTSQTSQKSDPTSWRRSQP